MGRSCAHWLQLGVNFQIKKEWAQTDKNWLFYGILNTAIRTVRTNSLKTPLESVFISILQPCTHTNVILKFSKNACCKHIISWFWASRAKKNQILVNAACYTDVESARLALYVHCLLYWRYISHAGPERYFENFQQCLLYAQHVMVLSATGQKKSNFGEHCLLYRRSSARLAQGWRAGEWSWFWSFRIPIIPYFEHWS